ncbi:outer membrane protein assembly factor BamB family protein [Actinoplanes aureus]|uniref:PQQ-binding-like beta-propeller repeat protein n=1 Tax=Actinoplanes aureus TaxID=2792083 RepID=A0A931C3Z0_9ACTN|nr:PQQ-binding-like beta-propeller repeat protein [Actinoplanes aureus]MBG0560003.1 PQQ-binding-like beta-propeller repeat protein [Actinoplanes aureus]
MGADTYDGPVVIDLGLERGEPESYHRPGRRTTSPWFGPALVVLLVLFGVTTAGPPSRPPLAEVLRVAIGPGDPYAVDDGRLLIQTTGRLSSYQLADGGLRWQIQQHQPVYRLRTGGGKLLLRPWNVGREETGTTAISLDTGTREWHNDRNVVSFPGTALLFAVEGVRSTSGIGRRVQNEVEVIDPAVGLARWRVHVPNTAVLLSVPGSMSRIMLLRDDQTADLYDVPTGAHLASRTFPVADYDPENPVVIGDAVLLRHPGRGSVKVSAYDTATLRELWSVRAPSTQRIRPCGELACLIGPAGIRAVDPESGVESWRRPGWRAVEQYGNWLIAYSTDGTSDPVAVVDPATGRVLADVTGWRPVAGTTADGELLVTREIGPGPRTMVAVVAPGLDRPRLLADLPPGTGDCRSAPDRLVCRSMYGELIVWAYRTSTRAG